MKSMIMAAGVGSRLMPLTMEIPKPMVPMANRPLMENIVKLLAEHGFNEVIANLHYHADSIANYFGGNPVSDTQLLYSREDDLMGTAGGVKKCAWFLNETFVVMSGDALTDVDLSELMASHKKNGALATIAVKTVEEVEQFGVVVSSDDGRITRFQEKPQREEALSHDANTGIYIFEPEIFNYIPEHEFYDFGKQVFPHLVRIKAPFYAALTEDYWCDVGSLDTYRQAHSDILQGRVRVPANGILKRTAKANILIGPEVEIADDVQFSGDVIIGPGCRIFPGVKLDSCILWNDVQVAEQANLQGCILGAHAKVGKQVSVGTGTVIGAHCQLKSGLQIGPRYKVSRSSQGGLEMTTE